MFRICERSDVPGASQGFPGPSALQEPHPSSWGGVSDPPAASADMPERSFRRWKRKPDRGNLFLSPLQQLHALEGEASIIHLSPPPPACCMFALTDRRCRGGAS